MSLKPIGGMAPAHACKPSASSGRDALLRRKFGYLSEYQFAVAQTLWEELKLNPWLGHFTVRNDQGEIKIVPTLAGLMSLIIYAPGFQANAKRQFVMDDRSRLPISCISTIDREINGRVVSFAAEVYWEDVFGPDPRELSKIILTYGRDSLGSRGDVRAIRMAYADVIGNLSIEEEAPVQRLRDAARTSPDERRS